MKRVLFLLSLSMVFCAAGCTKTWVDDNENFKRVFGFEKPSTVQVVHSYYCEKTNLLGTTYKYHFIAFRSLDGKIDPAKSRSVRPEAPDNRSRYGCDPNPPSWFVAKTPEHYEMWVSTISPGVRSFRDKDDGTIYSCAGKGQP